MEYIPAFPHSDIIDCGAKVGIVPLIMRQERHSLHIADGYDLRQISSALVVLKKVPAAELTQEFLTITGTAMASTIRMRDAALGRPQQRGSQLQRPARMPFSRNTRPAR